mgnify:CR=1 FL=1
MKKQVLGLGKPLSKTAQKLVKGGIGPFNIKCNTDRQCPFCHTCEVFPNGNKYCIGNC